MLNVYDEYVLARWFYLMGEPRLSDTEYDNLEREFKAMYPEDIHAKQSWSYDTAPVEQLTAIGRTDLIVSTTMDYMAESISSVNTVSEYNQRFGNLQEPSRLSYKIDGWNTRVNYFNGNLVSVGTRGRGGSNLDLKALASKFPRKIDIPGRAAITGELNIANDVWPAYRSMTGNTDQRASVRTAIARGDIDVLSYCAFNIFAEDVVFPDQYAKLQELGFTVPFFKFVSNKRELDSALRYFSDMAPYYDYLTDGLVIENSNIQLAIRLGAWEEKIMSSRVTGYEVNPGMYGNYLKVRCEPVNIGGKTYSRVSINNIASIIENNLQIGNPIAFSQRSAANVVIDTLQTRTLQEREGLR